MVKRYRVKITSSTHAEWYDKECRDAKLLCRHKLRILRICKNNNAKNDRTYDKEKDDYLEAKKKYKQLVKQKKQHFQKAIADSLTENKNKPTLFWNEVRKLGGGKKAGISNNISIEQWFEHFRDIFSAPDERVNEETHIVEENLDKDTHALNDTITVTEVKDSVRKLKNGKACGTDGIISEMLKTGNPEIIYYLTKLFNVIFDKGLFPEEWVKAIIVPIFKKGHIDQPDNYRGVSLLNIICKCYSSILNKRLYTWLEKNETFVENQAGFRRNYSTTDQIFSLYAAIQKGLSKKGQKVYVAFVDFRKAFDSVQRDKLLECLQKEGINGKFFSSIKSMYSALFSCVKIKNILSDFFECPIGVRQGCVLSPTLFLLFINQLANYINEHGVQGIQMLPGLLELFVLLFADDVALIAATPQGLQSQLNCLKICCDELKMKINKDKTKIMVFRKGGYLSKYEKWFFDGDLLEVVNSYCYLGFTFTTSLSPKLGTNYIAAKGKKAVHSLHRAFQKCKNMNQKTFFKIFDSKIQPILLYSSEIWGYNNIESIEKIHLLACKNFLGVPLRTPNKMIYSELNRYPLYINAYIRCIKYWFRLLQLEENRLPKQAYIMMMSMDRNGKKCWVTKVRELLSNTGFHYVWLDQGVNDVNSFLQSFKQRLTDIHIQEWFSATESSSRYDIYRSFKSMYKQEEYLNFIDIFCFRVALTQIRFGVLPLNNNLNRYRDDIKHRNCPFCVDVAEDERHFIYTCPLYVDLRKRFLENVSSMPLHKIIAGKNKEISITVSKYIFLSIKRRNSFLDIL